jgi:hypothetical protein
LERYDRGVHWEAQLSMRLQLAALGDSALPCLHLRLLMALLLLLLLLLIVV